jgi:hypothetical protein
VIGDHRGSGGMEDVSMMMMMIFLKKIGLSQPNHMISPSKSRAGYRRRDQLGQEGSVGSGRFSTFWSLQSRYSPTCQRYNLFFRDSYLFFMVNRRLDFE